MHTTIRTARRGLSLLTVGLLAALALLALTSGHNRAGAQPYPPTTSCAISTLNQTVQAGESINLNGSGFPANSTVALTLHSATTSLGTVRTDANGAFTKTVTIPASLVGTNHTIEASTGSVTCAFDPFVTKGVDAVASSHHATRGTDALATTGFETLTASVIAVALLAGGGLLLLLGRRRRHN